MPTRFVAFLTGAEEVPPVRTLARGEAIFTLDDNQRVLEYRLTVTNIRGMTAAHIHLGGRRVNGPVVVNLFNGRPGITVTNGTINGRIRTRDLVGPLQDATLADLIRRMVNRTTYVNVHTERNPEGEIRGQIRRTD